uniref:hypothetical protein n=1 Tax=uncultured Phyllobacterium sp. TaxID=253813 RepID=UPI00258C447F
QHSALRQDHNPEPERGRPKPRKAVNRTVLTPERAKPRTANNQTSFSQNTNITPPKAGLSSFEVAQKYQRPKSLVQQYIRRLIMLKKFETFIPLNPNNHCTGSMPR